MIVCEYLFKEFNTSGSDEYIDSWASHVDHMAGDGWEVLECIHVGPRVVDCGRYCLAGKTGRAGMAPAVQIEK